MTIRKATALDAGRINELLYAVANVHAEGRPDIFKRGTKKYTDEQLLQIINGEKTPIFVAVDEKNCALGYAFCVEKTTDDSLLFQARKTLYIDDICVDEVVRGRGVGTALFEYVEAFAKAQGFDEITLNVWAFNEAAYAFYQKRGMREQKITMEKSLR